MDFCVPFFFPAMVATHSFPICIFHLKFFFVVFFFFPLIFFSHNSPGDGSGRKISSYERVVSVETHTSHEPKGARSLLENRMSEDGLNKYY